MSRWSRYLGALAVAFALVPNAAASARSHHRPAHHHQRRARAGESTVARQWYDITDQTVAAASFPEPATQSRTWAVSWLAAARALRNKHDDNPSYSVGAFAQALHDTLVAQVPSQQSALDAALHSTLGTVPDGPAKAAGIAAGAKQAASVPSAKATAWTPRRSTSRSRRRPPLPAYGSRRRPPSRRRSGPARAMPGRSCSAQPTGSIPGLPRH